jgi:hypothetical protein
MIPTPMDDTLTLWTCCSNLDRTQMVMKIPTICLLATRENLALLELHVVPVEENLESKSVDTCDSASSNLACSFIQSVVSDACYVDDQEVSSPESVISHTWKKKNRNFIKYMCMWIHKFILKIFHENNINVRKKVTLKQLMTKSWA